VERYVILYRSAVTARSGNVAAVLIVSIPLWWILGLDQAAWLAAGFALGAHALAARGIPRGIVVASASFLVVVAVSGILGASGTRWLTFGREILIVVAFFGALAGAAAMAPQLGPIRNLTGAIALFTVATSAVTLWALVTQNPLTFRTPIAGLVPEVIADTRLGQLSLIVRSLGSPSLFIADLAFLRPQGFFLFSTSQAVALIAVIPLLVAGASWWPSRRALLRAAAVMAAVALIATTTRVPIAALLGAGALVLAARAWARGRVTLRLNRTTVPVILLALGGASAAAFALGMSDEVMELLATRSPETRASLYLATLDRWADRPILGWGTEVDWNEALPPLGSHSQYLGVLFKQGLAGLVLFLVIVGYVGAAAIALFRRNPPAGDLLIIGFLATAASAITESLWLDPGTGVLVGIAWGMVIGIARQEA